MNYKPYSQEWHRHRYLKEAIEKYLDDGTDPSVIVDDIADILHVRSEAAYREFNRINQIEHYITAVKETCSQPNTD
tara:strand:- start:182 stop:409 length:228 start_codon:yes stop_codon:yes gene_type:complete